MLHAIERAFMIVGALINRLDRTCPGLPVYKRNAAISGRREVRCKLWRPFPKRVTRNICKKLIPWVGRLFPLKYGVVTGSPVPVV